MTHITCRLTAKNWDQLRNPTLDNRVRATFTFLKAPMAKSKFHRRKAWRTKKQEALATTARRAVSLKIVSTAAEP